MSKKELDHLYLSKNERIGILILFFLLLILIIVPWLYYKPEAFVVHTTDKELPTNNKVVKEPEDIQITKQKNSIESYKRSSNTKISIPIHLSEFDPNHLDLNKAKELGISEKSFHILQKYLATGAKIKYPNQLRKIYGIDEGTYKKLEPYIIIKQDEKTHYNAKSTKTKSIVMVDVNTAKPEELISLPGIGEKLAARIIKYRNLLGGFASVSQFNEIYGLQDSIIQKFKAYISINGPVIKLNINDASYESLSKHPYLGYKKAKLICEYRKQHPKFTGIPDLYKLTALDSNSIQRITIYLRFD